MSVPSARLSVTMARPWPIERKGDRVVVVSIKSNKANVITETFMSEFAATLDALEANFPSDAVVLTGTMGVTAERACNCSVCTVHLCLCRCDIGLSF